MNEGYINFDFIEVCSHRGIFLLYLTIVLAYSNHSFWHVDRSETPEATMLDQSSRIVSCTRIATRGHRPRSQTIWDQCNTIGIPVPLLGKEFAHSTAATK